MSVTTYHTPFRRLRLTFISRSLVIQIEKSPSSAQALSSYSLSLSHQRLLPQAAYRTIVDNSFRFLSLLPRLSSRQPSSLTDPNSDINPSPSQPCWPNRSESHDSTRRYDASTKPKTNLRWSTSAPATVGISFLHGALLCPLPSLFFTKSAQPTPRRPQLNVVSRQCLTTHSPQPLHSHSNVCSTGSDLAVLRRGKTHRKQQVFGTTNLLQTCSHDQPAFHTVQHWMTYQAC